MSFDKQNGSTQADVLRLQMSNALVMFPFRNIDCCLLTSKKYASPIFPNIFASHILLSLAEKSSTPQIHAISYSTMQTCSVSWSV